MKLPSLPLSGTARTLESGAVAKARAREQEITAGVQGVAQLSGAVLKATARNANNEALLNATKRTEVLTRSIAEERRALELKYLNDPSLPMDQYLQDDEQVVQNAIKVATDKATPRIEGYMRETLSKIRGGALLGKRYEFYNETLQLRSTDTINDLIDSASSAIMQDPDAHAGYSNLTGVIEALEVPGPFKKTLKDSAAMGIDTAWAESMLNHARPMELIDALDSGKYNATLGRNYDQYLDRAVQQAGVLFSNDQQEALTTVLRNPDAGDTLRETAEGLVKKYSTGNEAVDDERLRAFSSNLVVSEIQGYEIAGRSEYALERLNSGAYDGVLSADDLASETLRLQKSLEIERANNATLAFNRADNYVTALTQGAETDPAQLGTLTAIATDPAYTESTRARASIKAGELAVWEENKELYQNIEKLSGEERAERVAEATELASAAGGTTVTADVRQRVAAHTASEVANFERALAADPAGIALSVSSRVQGAYSNASLATQMSLSPQRTAASVAAAQGQWVAYAQATRSEQLRQGVHPDDVVYIPANDAMVRNMAAVLDSENNYSNKIVTLQAMQDLMPPEIVADVVAELDDAAPLYSQALAFIADDLHGEADMLLRGAPVREFYNGETAPKTFIKDRQVMEALNRLDGGLPTGTMPEDSIAGLVDGLLTYYYGRAGETELKSGRVDTATLREARDATIGPPVTLDNVVGSRTLSYRRKDQNNRVVTPEEFRAQFRSLASGELILPPMYGADGTLHSQTDVLRTAALYPVDDGVYQIVPQMSTSVSVSGLVTEGIMYQRDDDGSLRPYRVNLNDYVLPPPSLELYERKFGEQ